MAIFSLFYLLCLQGVLMNLGHTKLIEHLYLPQPICTTTIVSSLVPQTPPTATVYVSVVTATSSVKCSGCALTTAEFVEPPAESQTFDTTITLSTTTLLSYVCKLGSTKPTVSTTTNATAKHCTLATPSTTTNLTAKHSITIISSSPVPIANSATCYTPNGPISSTPAKTVDGNGKPVSSGCPGIIVRDFCPETKEEVAQCPLLCFAKSFGPNTPQFQCAKFFDDVLFHSCSPCAPPCDPPVTSASGTPRNSTISLPRYTYG